MNVRHFQTFVWLRWRLFVNQMRRGGAVNAVFAALLAVGALFLSAFLALMFFLVGLFVLPGASPAVLMYAWDGVVAGFLFGWAVGLLVELQRSEALSLDKFLHLPVSLKSAFLINYLSSMVNFSLIVFLPGMAALSLGLVFGRGPAMLLLFPLLAAFFLMVTGLTYQFQGWLAALMVNPRRRRTVIVLLTMAFVLVFQLPNLFNILYLGNSHGRGDVAAQVRQEQDKLNRSLAAGEIGPAEYQKRSDENQRSLQAKVAERDARELGQLETTASLLNVILPPGWLPLGAKGAAEGNLLPALLGVLGMGLIGTAALWRAYRTTLRLYTGQFSSGKPKAVAVAVPTKAAAPATNVLEKRLPWLSEPASAVALAGFRSLLRAPEAKMLLLTPIILLVVFGSIFFAQSVTIPEGLRPLLPYAAMMMALFSMVQLVGNQFGFDRGGFRVFVLSAAPRRDILLGKNLAVVPLGLAMAAPIVVLAAVLCPMRLDYLAAVVPQGITMYLLFCLIANWMSILVPVPVRAGSFKPVNTKAGPILLQVAFALLAPLALLPALLPYGVDFAVAEWGGVRGLPVCLALSLLECAAVFFLYRLVLNGQGALLQAREQRILEVVTTKAE